MPNLFDSYSLKGSTLRNRIAVGPMCQYMAQDGVPNDWHSTHYTSLSRRGAGLVTLEATPVPPDGRITPNRLRLSHDTQAAACAPIIASMHTAAPVPRLPIAPPAP